MTIALQGDSCSNPMYQQFYTCTCPYKERAVLLGTFFTAIDLVDCSRVPYSEQYSQTRVNPIAMKTLLQQSKLQHTYYLMCLY